MLFFAPLPVRFPVGPKSRCHHNLLTCFVKLVHSWTASLGAASASSPACPSSCYLPEANQYAPPGPNSHLFTSNPEHCFFPLLGSPISPTSFPLDLTLISSLFLSLSQWITSWGSHCALKLPSLLLPLESFSVPFSCAFGFSFCGNKIVSSAQFSLSLVVRESLLLDWSLHLDKTVLH